MWNKKRLWISLVPHPSSRDKAGEAIESSLAFYAQPPMNKSSLARKSCNTLVTELNFIPPRLEAQRPAIPVDASKTCTAPCTTANDLGKACASKKENIIWSSETETGAFWQHLASPETGQAIKNLGEMMLRLSLWIWARKSLKFLEHVGPQNSIGNEVFASNIQQLKGEINQLPVESLRSPMRKEGRTWLPWT